MQDILAQKFCWKQMLLYKYSKVSHQTNTCKLTCLHYTVKVIDSLLPLAACRHSGVISSTFSPCDKSDSCRGEVPKK